MNYARFLPVWATLALNAAFDVPLASVSLASPHDINYVKRFETPKPSQTGISWSPPGANLLGFPLAILGSDTNHNSRRSLCLINTEKHAGKYFSKAGFVDVSTGTDTGRICLRKVNECADPARYGVRCSLNAVCVDTEDGYYCDCLAGFQDVSFNYQLGRGERCVPQVDECALNTHDCSSNADCRDLAEGYTCACRSGFLDVSPDPSNYPGRDCNAVNSYTSPTVSFLSPPSWSS